MKMVFNFKLVHATIALFSALLITSAFESQSRADTRYFSRSQILKAFFPASDKVGFKTYKPSEVERTSLRRRLGYDLPKSTYYIFVASSMGSDGVSTIDGYAFIDEQMGQHQPITFAVKLSPSGVVLREEVMVYRESHGDEVRSQRFSRQFRGKTVHDLLRTDRDIDSISGATISSRAITTGVRRALVLFNSAIVVPQSARNDGHISLLR